MTAAVVVACGGRDYLYRANLYRVLDRLLAKHPALTLIVGRARGADTLAEQWAVERGVPFEPYKPDYDRHGRYRAPKIRNRTMRDRLLTAREAGHVVGVVAFPGGSGTADMVAIAKGAEPPIPVWEIAAQK